MSGKKEVEYIQLDLEQMLKEKKMTKTSKSEGTKTRTIYEMEAKYIQDILKARDIFKDIKEGDPVFFSAYFNVTSGGKKKSGPH